MSQTTASILKDTSETNGSTKSIQERTFHGGFKFSDVLIPSDVGSGLVKWHHQKRTMMQYACLATAGLLAFYRLENPRLRAAGLGLLFPGAGLIAVCTIPAIIAFIVSTALIPLVLFAWFGCGGVTFPIGLWSGTVLLAAALARASVLEFAGPLWVAICVAGIGYMTTKSSAANTEAREKRVRRNEYLVDAVERIHTAEAPKPGTREISERDLRFVQWIVEMGLSDKNDWSHHDVIDQFQTSAIRYQLYDGICSLGTYQYIFAPNFHGYLSQAQRNLIEKSLTQKVMNFWKWESILGKFKTADWDPIKKDDIMVSGYILQAASVYQSNTGDKRYSKKGALEFQVTETAKYKYDLRSVAEAVYCNMDENPYCLYPCEPNWVYTLCNLVGISGLVISDRLLGNNYAQQLKDRFLSSLEREFTRQDGTILPIRSELTGFTIPGLAGTISDSIIAILGAAYMPHIAHRNWAIIKEENIKYDEDGELQLVNLTGADKLDPGNYKEGKGSIRASVAASAAEYGDEKIRQELLRQLEEEFHPIFETKSGALRYKGLSTLGHTVALRARLSRYQDWRKMIVDGPPQNVLRGPLLDIVPFPDVLVAKAYSQDGESVDLVLYPGVKPGNFMLGFSRLGSGQTYSLGEQSAKADADGRASFDVIISGRTELRLQKSS